jgi:hypothetical protein
MVWFLHGEIFEFPYDSSFALRHYFGMVNDKATV